MSDPEFRQALTETVDDIRYRNRRTVLGGRRLDANTVTLAGAPDGKSWVRGFDQSREQTAVWGSVNAINAPIEIDMRPDGDYEIINPDWMMGAATQGDSVRSTTQPPGGETVPKSVPGQSYVPLRVEASQLGGLNIHIRSGWYDADFYDGDALDPATALPTLNDIDLSGTTPATAGYSNWVVVWFNPSSISIGFAANAEIGGTAALLSETAIDLSVVPAGCYPLGAVGLEYGQTVIDITSRIADLRLHVGSKGALLTGTAVTRTIASGVLAVGGESVVVVAPESGSSDTLVTLTVEGLPRELWLIADTGATITLDTGAGNIFVLGGSDLDFTDAESVVARYDGTNVYVVSGGGGGGGSAATTTALGTLILDETPVSGDGIALTLLRLGMWLGVAMLAGDRTVPSYELPTNPDVSASETTRWTRSASNPVLSGTATWEEDTTIEPTVMYEDTGWKMWYRGGGWSGHAALGYATSTDGVAWTKYSTDPIFGEGFGGYAGDLFCPNVIKEGDYYYLYFTDTLAGGGDLYVSRSLDGITGWTAPAVVLSHSTYGWIDQFANSTVWVEQGNQWKMLVECRLGSAVWFIALGTSTDPLTGWTMDAFGALTDLQPAAGAGWSGPFVPFAQRFEGNYVLYYHGTPSSGVLPSNLYRAVSNGSDLTHWTQYAHNPILTYAASGFEIDQVADPCVVEVHGKSYLYYDGDDNTGFSGAIGLLTFDGTLAELAGERGRTAWLQADDTIDPAILPLATSSAFGVVKPDNTTITIAGGVISGAAGAAYAPLSTGDPADPLILDSDGRVLVGRIA